ncbi:hypothetical protein [Clostridium butyricum]|uniref:hypothetical protein n=1 Tax=Clostridium butyricum TaxID=1492 RepID=UPI00129B718B|nr:hypothetical protein [Clostridium butyricum]QGH20224.1 hypothetical protein EBL75_00940 [Clostridium butyricum]QGH24259.1 hypothetical protein EBQ27_00940 [Clostridium butyricum]
MEYIFDITNFETALSFLCNYLAINEEQVINFITSNSKDYDIEEFIDEFSINIDSLDIDNVKAVVIHTTTNNDECNTIKKYGLLNLQQAVTVNTPLKLYLKRWKIVFDIENKTMWLNDKLFDITYNNRNNPYHADYDEALQDIARKLYFDFQINGFFCTEDVREYGGRVHERPEFLNNLSEKFKHKPIEDKWKENSKCYLIKFSSMLDYFTHFTFYKDKDEYLEDFNTKVILKRWLINKALYVIWNNLHFGGNPEIIAYMKPEVIIPYSDILEIIDVL